MEKKQAAEKALKGYYSRVCNHLYWSDEEWGKHRSETEILADILRGKGRILYFSRSQALADPVYKERVEDDMEHLTSYRCLDCAALYDEIIRLKAEEQTAKAGESENRPVKQMETLNEKQKGSPRETKPKAGRIGPCFGKFLLPQNEAQLQLRLRRFLPGQRIRKYYGDLHKRIPL